MITTRIAVTFTLAMLVCLGLSGLTNRCKADSQSVAHDYKICPGDQLDVSVIGHDELKQTVTVLPDGTFDFPIAGRIRASGLTLQAVRLRIVQGLSDEFNQPEVSVIAHDVDLPKVSVLGAVKTPGLYELKPGWRLLEAIAASGGPAQDSALTKVTVIRNSGTQKVPVNFVALMQDNDGAQDVALNPGDVILVEEMDPSTAEVQVLGSVEKPSTYFVPSTGSSVISLLAQAGGPTKDAELSQVQIMHGGRVQTLDLRAHMSTLNDSVANTSLVPGDVLLVPENRKMVAILGEVHEPANYPMPDGQALTPSAALALAGGPTPSANTRNGSILRRDATGKLTIIPVNFNAILSGKSTAAETPLQSGDILYLPTKGQNNFNPWNLASLLPWLGAL